MRIKITVYGGGEASNEAPQDRDRSRPIPPPKRPDKLPPSATIREILTQTREFCNVCNREGLISSLFTHDAITCPECLGAKFVIKPIPTKTEKLVVRLREARVAELPNALAFAFCLFIGLTASAIAKAVYSILQFIF